MMPEQRPKSREGKTRRILSVPLSPEQKEELARRAGREPVSAYVRERLFPANDNDPAGKPARSRAPVKDAAALARLLALLGPAASALKDIAHRIASGLLPFEPDTEAALRKACADIAEMKKHLMKALGIRER